MLIKAYAKINWNLNVLGTRPDGYHELDMLMQSVDLCDDVELSESDGLSLSITGPRAGGLNADDTNLMLRAARMLMRETGVRGGAAMRLTKRIPMQAGMGGGSSDAAAVLTGLNRMWNAGLSMSELCGLGVKLGADVPYCIGGGLCRAEGLGEKLTRAPGAPELELIMAMPAAGLSTKDVFGACSACPRQDTTRALCELRAQNWEWLNEYTANDLERAAGTMRPQIGECVELMRRCGAKFARMTGSGSAVFGVFDGAQVDAALARISAVYPDSFRARTLGC